MRTWNVFSLRSKMYTKWLEAIFVTLKSFLRPLPSSHRRNNNVVITSKRRHCNVTRLKWRENDVIIANVSTGITSKYYDISRHGSELVGSHEYTPWAWYLSNCPPFPGMDFTPVNTWVHYECKTWVHSAVMLLTMYSARSNKTCADFYSGAAYCSHSVYICKPGNYTLIRRFCN